MQETITTDLNESVQRDAIHGYIIELLTKIIEPWDDLGEITPDTQLGTLGLESLNLVLLIAGIQQKYELQDRLFQRLIAREQVLKEYRISELVNLVCEIQASEAPR